MQHARAGGPDGLQTAARQALGDGGPGADGGLALLVGGAARREQPAQVARAEAVLPRVLLRGVHWDGYQHLPVAVWLHNMLVL